MNMENKSELEREGQLIATNYLNTNYLDHEEICALISYVQKLIGRLTQQHELTYEETMFLSDAYDDLGRCSRLILETLRQRFSRRIKMNSKEVIEKELKALEIIKEYLFVFVENGQLKSGRYGDIEILLDEDDFETKEDYELLKEVLEE